jgi:DNA-binding response OmpR family regulator
VLDAGADDYVSKPSTPEKLRARLEIAARRIAQEEARRTAEAELARGALAGRHRRDDHRARARDQQSRCRRCSGHAELL